jgi:hypothetical protein
MKRFAESHRQLFLRYATCLLAYFYCATAVGFTFAATNTTASVSGSILAHVTISGRRSIR